MPVRLLRVASFVALLPALLAAPAAQGQQHPVLSQVSSLSAPVPTSPLIAVGAAWTPLVAGGNGAIFHRADGDDPRLGYAPQLVAVAREWGKGRIVCASRAFTTATAVGAASNERFHINAHAWLRNGRPGFIRWTTAHAEQSELGLFLINFASTVGQPWLPIVGPVGTPELAATGVLYIDDPDIAFSAAERSAVLTWVAQGGGLWVNASGYRWASSHPGLAPETSHPVAQLLAETGLLPVRATIRNGIAEISSFAKLGDDAYTGDPVAAAEGLVALHQQYGASLATLIESDAVVRRRFDTLHSIMAYPSILELTGDLPLSAAGGCVSVYNASLDFYGHLQNYQSSSLLAAAVARERLWRTYIDSGYDDAAVRTQLADIAGWSGSRRTLFIDHKLIVLDNQMSTAPQSDSILAWLSRMPAGRVPLRALTILDFLGFNQPSISLDGRGYKVNVFGVLPGTVDDPPFPAEFVFWPCDIYTQTVAHEVTHVLDSAYIQSNPARNARRQALLADAGVDPQNFLRSLPQFPAGFFAQNPGEFIASIANQWVAESQLCLQLGRQRLGAGRRQPLEQALFFADMLSTGDTVPFFRCRLSGVVQSRIASLGRDANGRIVSITDGGVRLDIGYDAQGRVVSAVQTAQDCDADGVPDFEEILFLGTGADTDANMRLDGCTTLVDIDQSGVVDGGDLAWLLSRWGLSAKQAPECDLDADGAVGAGDLSILLNNWGLTN
jgi:YD repeat-containing protein